MTAGSIARTLTALPVAWRWLAFFAAVLLAWTTLFAMSAAPTPDTAAGTEAFGIDYLISMCQDAAADAAYPILFAMWAVMSAAMMAPTAFPAFKTYDDLTHAGDAATTTGFWALIGGYLFVWLGFAAMAAALQVALSQAGFLDAEGKSVTPVLNAVLLMVAGGYQFSNLKEACLSQCRAPLTFFMGHWRDGPGGAVAMGLRLGAVCIGCCWALMVLAFVGGTMSLAWMGAATLLMTLEKLPEIGRVVTRPLGVTLMAGGLFAGARAFGLV